MHLSLSFSMHFHEIPLHILTFFYMCVLELLRHKSDTVLELLMGERERECSEFNIVMSNDLRR